jgi:glycosyltransferase involved in cell wall biosynthesis
MPAYNEAESLPGVLDEWLPVLRSEAGQFTFCALNDGSTDATLEVLERYRADNPELRVVDKPNSGHAQTCMLGYREACSAGARWVLQIDSDGQCDPRFFPSLWRQRQAHPVVYGYRRRREDGRLRSWVSRIVSLTTWIGQGVWVADANVPYRLMATSALEPYLDQVPRDFHLANILLSAFHQRDLGIHWVDIVFRDRTGGSPSVRPWAFAGRGWQLLRQLRSTRRGSASEGVRRSVAP